MGNAGKKGVYVKPSEWAYRIPKNSLTKGPFKDLPFDQYVKLAKMKNSIREKSLKRIPNVKTTKEKKCLGETNALFDCFRNHRMNEERCLTESSALIDCLYADNPKETKNDGPELIKQLRKSGAVKVQIFHHGRKTDAFDNEVTPDPSNYVK